MTPPFGPPSTKPDTKYGADMRNVTTKLGLFGLGLVTVFAAMFGVGTLVGPVLSETPEDQVESTDHDADDDTEH